VVYVGRGNPIWARLNAHFREGRPHEGVAVISGLQPQRAEAVEHAYVSEWRPPWNCARTQGHAPGLKALRAALESGSREGIAAEYAARGGRELSFMKSWELHVLGCRQASAPASP
jgi:hypothetical protein